jgi:hypothetical protein
MPSQLHSGFSWPPAQILDIEVKIHPTSFDRKTRCLLATADLETFKTSGMYSSQRNNSLDRKFFSAVE